MRPMSTPPDCNVMSGRLDKFSERVDFAPIVTAQLQAELKARRAKEAAGRAATEEATAAARSKEASERTVTGATSVLVRQRPRVRLLTIGQVPAGIR